MNNYKAQSNINFDKPSIALLFTKTYYGYISSVLLYYILILIKFTLKD